MIELDFQIRQGSYTLDARLSSTDQVTGLIGPSGSGKTTLLMALAGIIRPTGGLIGIKGGATFFDSGRGINLPIEKRRVGVVFQDDLLFLHLNVRENFLFGYNRTEPGLRKLHPQEICHLLDLGLLLERGTGELSGGEARRVAVGRALLTSPCLLLLDEPLTGLDVRLRDRILAYLLRIKSELSIPMVYVSHSYSDILAIADSVALIDVETDSQSRKHARVAALGHPYDIIAEAGKVASIGPIETVIPGELVATDPEAGYSVVRGEGIEMHVSPDRENSGKQCYVTVRADDIILSVGEVPKLSSRNVWTGKIGKIERLKDTYVVTLDVGNKIRAAVTAEAVRELGLEPGKTVHAIVKAKSLRAVVLGPEAR